MGNKIKESANMFEAPNNPFFARPSFDPKTSVSIKQEITPLIIPEKSEDQKREQILANKKAEFIEKCKTVSQMHKSDLKVAEGIMLGLFDNLKGWSLEDEYELEGQEVKIGPEEMGHFVKSCEEEMTNLLKKPSGNKMPESSEAQKGEQILANKKAEFIEKCKTVSQMHKSDLEVAKGIMLALFQNLKGWTLEDDYELEGQKVKIDPEEMGYFVKSCEEEMINLQKRDQILANKKAEFIEGCNTVFKMYKSDLEAAKEIMLNIFNNLKNSAHDDIYELKDQDVKISSEEIDHFVKSCEDHLTKFWKELSDKKSASVSDKKTLKQDSEAPISKINSAALLETKKIPEQNPVISVEEKLAVKDKPETSTVSDKVEPIKSQHEKAVHEVFTTEIEYCKTMDTFFKELKRIANSEINSPDVIKVRDSIKDPKKAKIFLKDFIEAKELAQELLSNMTEYQIKNLTTNPFREGLSIDSLSEIIASDSFKERLTVMGYLATCSYEMTNRFGKIEQYLSYYNEMKAEKDQAKRNQNYPQMGTLTIVSAQRGPRYEILLREVSKTIEEPEGSTEKNRLEGLTNTAIGFIQNWISKFQLHIDYQTNRYLEKSDKQLKKDFEQVHKEVSKIINDPSKSQQAKDQAEIKLKNNERAYKAEMELRARHRGNPLKVSHLSPPQQINPAASLKVKDKPETSTVSDKVEPIKSQHEKAVHEVFTTEIEYCKTMDTFFKELKRIANSEINSPDVIKVRDSIKDPKKAKIFLKDFIEAKELAQELLSNMTEYQIKNLTTNPFREGLSIDSLSEIIASDSFKERLTVMGYLATCSYEMTNRFGKIEQYLSYYNEMKAEKDQAKRNQNYPQMGTLTIVSAQRGPRYEILLREVSKTIEEPEGSTEKNRLEGLTNTAIGFIQNWISKFQLHIDYQTNRYLEKSDKQLKKDFEQVHKEVSKIINDPSKSQQAKDQAEIKLKNNERAYKAEMELRARHRGNPLKVSHLSPPEVINTLNQLPEKKPPAANVTMSVPHSIATTFYNSNNTQTTSPNIAPVAA